MTCLADIILTPFWRRNSSDAFVSQSEESMAGFSGVHTEVQRSISKKIPLVVLSIKKKNGAVSRTGTELPAQFFK
jgi:hypothetical protein